MRILQGDTGEEGKAMDEKEYTEYKTKNEESQKKGGPNFAAAKGVDQCTRQTGLREAACKNDL